MKAFILRTLFLAISTLAITSCGAPATEANEPEPAAETIASTEGMPDDFVATLNVHGGLDNWKSFRQLGYAMPRGEGHETQLVDLYDRREYIKQPVSDGGDPIEMGFDGENVWVTADTTYKGNPMFYKNLMFYFYAMPWVLADPGIVYSPAEPITYDGVTYPGIMVGYDDGVGFSPKDNYRLREGVGQGVHCELPLFLQNHLKLHRPLPRQAGDEKTYASKASTCQLQPFSRLPDVALPQQPPGCVGQVVFGADRRIL